MFLKFNHTNSRNASHTGSTMPLHRPQIAQINILNPLIAAIREMQLSLGFDEGRDSRRTRLPVRKWLLHALLLTFCFYIEYEEDKADNIKQNHHANTTECVEQWLLDSTQRDKSTPFHLFTGTIDISVRHCL